MAPKGNPNWRKGGPSPNPSGQAKRADVMTQPRLAGLAAAIQPHLDGYANATTGLGGAMDKTMGTTFSPDIIDANTAEMIWRGDPIGARLVEMRADDATSDQPELCMGDYEAPEYYKPKEPKALPGTNVMPGKPLRKDAAGTSRVLNAWERRVVQALGRQRRRIDSADSKSMSEDITHHLGRSGLDAMTMIREAIHYREAYGGSAIFIGANDYATDLRQPLDLTRVRSLDYLTPLESRELVPLYYYNDPFAPNFGRPAIYQLIPFSVGSPIDRNIPARATQIHESRLIVFSGPRVSRRALSGALPGWGDSVFTRVYRALRSYSTAIANIDVLLSSFAQAIYKIKGLAASLLSNPNALTDAMMAVELCRSMVNAVIIDEGEEFKRESVSLTGYADMIDRLAINVAAAWGGPLTRLYGTSAKGLNATGDNDEAFYFAGVGKLQTHVVAPAYLRIVEIEMAVRGEDPENTTHSLAFKPLYRPSELQIAQTRLAVAQADHIYVTDKVVSAEETALSRFAGDTWSMETHLDLEARAAEMAVLPPPVNASPEPPPIPPAPGGAPVPPAAPRKDEDEGDDEGDDDEDVEALVERYMIDHGYIWQEDHADAYNPGQPRDKNGRWVKVGSSGSAGAAAAPKGKSGGKGATTAPSEKMGGGKGATKPAKGPKQSASAGQKAAAKAAVKEQRAAEKAAAKAAKAAAKEQRVAAKAVKAEERAKAKAERDAAKLEKSLKKEGKPRSDADFESDYEKFSASINQEELGAALSYTGAGYKNMNTFLRKGEIPEKKSWDWATPEALHEGAKHLDSALDKNRAQTDMKVYRISSDSNGKMREMQPGATMHDKAYMSTSQRPIHKVEGSIGEGEEKQPNVEFHITVPRHARAAAVTSNVKSEEHEYLIGRGGTLKITRREELGGGRVRFHARLMHTDPP